MFNNLLLKRYLFTDTVNLILDETVHLLASLAQPESTDIDFDESKVDEESKENSPKKPKQADERKIKSPVNKFAIKSKLNKDIFDLNAKKSSIDVKSRYELSCLLNITLNVLYRKDS